ncbi:MAG: hypothetical protein QOJ07_1839 [Thermoleophilaceae bacterium]|jgi:hypothetical protein|nr:hypothetical protein [Thermoleophilaceae bacterium]
MTIHQRRGSGTWIYWTYAIVILSICLFAFAVGYVMLAPPF